MSGNKGAIGEVTSGCRVFGAYKVYVGIKGIVPIIHGPVGCYWSNIFFQLAHNQGTLRSGTSALHDRDVVFGTENRLRQAIEAAKRYHRSEVIAILGCCVPALVGEDTELIRKEEVLDTIFIDATGFKGKEWEGYEEALLSLMPFIKKGERRKKTVNIFGLDAISPKIRADMAEIRRLLARCGFQVNAVPGVGSTFDQVQKMAEVERNVVFGGCGLKLAETMEDEFGIPYEIVEIPYGFDLTRRFLKQVTGVNYEENVMEELKRANAMLHRFYDMPVAVIGDCARVRAMAEFLFNELGCDVRFTASVSGSPLYPETEDDLFEIERAVQELGDELRLIFGTSFQKRVAHKLGIPLIRISHPIYDEISLCQHSPYMGYRGMVVLVEKILNLFLNAYPKEDW